MDWKNKIQNIKAGPVSGGSLEKFYKNYLVLKDLINGLDIIKDGYRVLDIGSGNGRLAMGQVDKDIEYHGLEIIKGCVEYCNEAFMEYPTFAFHYLDVYNKRYNPMGTIPPEAMILPFEDSYFNTITLTSVFTHIQPMLACEVYIQEIKRVLKKDGKLLCTWFTSPPNAPTLDEARTVYSIAEILDALKGFTIIKSFGGETKQPHDQLFLILCPK